MFKQQKRKYTWVSPQTKHELWSRVQEGELIKVVARDLGIKYDNAKMIVANQRRLEACPCPVQRR